MSSGRPAAVYDRVSERRRAVALAGHFREAEGLSITQIADRLGRSPATVKAYFYDPTYDSKKPLKATSPLCAATAPTARGARMGRLDRPDAVGGG